ncbi:unnamed protein product [Withania somnifera]
MDEADPMNNAEVRFRHDILLSLQTSWSDHNPGRRFWSCRTISVRIAKFFKWRDKGEVDPKSKFIISRLVNKIKELEKNYERIKMHLDKLESFKMQYDNLNTSQVDIGDSKEDKIQLDEESFQTKYENLNINSLDLEDSKDKGGDVEDMGDLKENKKEALRLDLFDGFD